MDLSTNIIFDIHNSDISNNNSDNFSFPLVNIFESILTPPTLSNISLNNGNNNFPNLFENIPPTNPINLNNLFSPPLNIFNNNNNNILNNSLYEKNSYKNILSSKGKKLLKKFKYKKDNFKCINCPILQIPFEENQDIIELPCKHIFDKDSILQWLEEEQSKCPVCRYELPYDEIKIEKKINQDVSNNDISNNDISNNNISNNNISNLPRYNFLQNAFNMVANRIEQEDLQQALINSMNLTYSDPSNNDLTVD